MGVLLQEISETIARQKQEDDGELRYQLCALIFLIGQLPHNNEPLDAGIRANAEMLADLLVGRAVLDKELQETIDARTEPWGVSVQSVELREIKIPSALQDTMSRQAQAERERQARIILGTAETEISEKFAQAAQVYQQNPIALHLRAMNMLYEAIKEKGAMVIVPSSVVETMGLGGMLGTAALSKQ